jgi:hypothetical protein
MGCTGHLRGRTPQSLWPGLHHHPLACCVAAFVKSLIDFARAMSEVISFVLVACVLSGCHTLTPDEQRVARIPHHQALVLKRLRECRNALPKGEVHEDFISPCAEMDVSMLFGINREDLVAARGKPDFCVGVSHYGVGRVNFNCLPDVEPAWDFFRYRIRISGIPSPALICQADANFRCWRFIWW